MQGTGSLSGFSRLITMPVEFEAHLGPRNLMQPVQSFDTDMFRLQGQINPIGDPDFDLLRIRGGTDFGHPSPGHTTLTVNPGPPPGTPGATWTVDSFFDIEYEIEFTGKPCPGSQLCGMSGSTTGTIRMQTGAPVCGPNATQTACIQTTCPVPPSGECVAHCGKLNPFTGQVTVNSCDCGSLNECHLVVPQIPAPAVVAGVGGNPCVVLDNGGGSVDLPPAGCDYLSPDEVHKIIDGLPAGTEIHLAPIHKDFICGGAGTQNPVCSFQALADCKEAGGSLGGQKECSESTLEFQLNGTGSLLGWNRMVSVPIGFETHTAPRTPGDPIQSFDTDMFRLFGQITNPGSGDPDFDLLRVVSGTDFGMPSPGHTTLTKLPGGPNWAVDSFFDIEYRIDFVGKPGGQLSGMSGSTTATIRMQTGSPLHCEGGCPVGSECQEKRVVNADGTIDVCCDCKPLPDPHRSADGTSITFGSPDVPAIPGGFFDPGSDPFGADFPITVNMQPGPMDTLIQRSSRMVCPLPPPAPCDPIEVEIVALDLVSVNPITVTGTGPDTMWDVAVGLSVQPQPEPPGPMQATKTHPNGGVFNAEIRVLPRLTFTEVGNPGNVRTIDYGLPARPPIRINFNNVPWVINLAPHLVGTIVAPSDGNFVPGVQEPPPWPNPNGQVVVTAFGLSKGGGVNHPVDPVPLCPLPGPAPDPCAPFQARDCAQLTAGDICVPTVILWIQGTPPQVLACGCRGTNECHVGSGAAGPNCVNVCPDPTLACTLLGTDTDGDGVDDQFSCNCDPPPVCEPNTTGTDCTPVTCPDTGTGVIDTCKKKCAILDSLTGDVTLSDCDCAGPNECHMEIATPTAGGPVAGVPPSSGNCVAVDDGTGTVKLPPDGCPYLSPDEFHKLYNGLPPGVTIEIGAIHKNFICNRQSDFCSFPIPPGVDCDDTTPNSPTDGAKECHDSTLELKLRGDMAGNAAGPSTYSRDLLLPVSFETHTGPRTPGMPVQSFDTDMFRLQGEIIGDPDFDLLRIRAGTDFGMPSPGHTTLTKLPGGPNWAVDSFFDVFYEIEFRGTPGGPFSGMSGSTTGTIRMQTNAYKCVGDCPPDTDCVETQTPDPLDPTKIKVCCECKPQPPQVCQPLPDRSGCTDTNCPCFGECIDGAYCDDIDCCLDSTNPPTSCLCYAKHAQESIKLCPAGGCFGQCLGGSYCDDPTDSSDCWAGGFPVCYAPNHHYSIYLCGGCFGSCQDGWYCDHPNPNCCLDSGNCQCYPPTHPNSIKLCGGLDKCKPKCVKYNQLTGQVTVEQCDCVGEECYVKFGTPAVTAGPGSPCEVVDNGSGSVDLPPAGCEYLTADEVHKIIDGLPAGTEIHLAPIHKDFICHEGQQAGVCSFPTGVDCREDGGDLGGEKECSDSTLEFQLTGTGTLAGWNRIVTIPNTSFETHIGKKKPFEPVQSFPTQMHRLFGQITNPGSGDPDFDLLRIVAGNDFGMPSPGHTTLTKLPIGPNWAVDSFFDIEYRIDFVGKPGGMLSGRSGSTTATIRMATPTKFKCSTNCPAGQTCVQTTTQLRSCSLSGAPCDDTPLGICPVGDTCVPNGSMTVCCDCVDTQICQPKPDKKSCTNNTCPPGVICKPKSIRCYPPPRGCEIEECECLDGDPCHPEMPTGTATVPVCTGGCPAPAPPNKCVRKKQPVPGQNGVFDYSCRCVPVHPKPIAADTSVPGKNRHLSVAYDGTPANTAGPGVLLAMRLRLTDLMNPNPPNLPANPPPDFTAYEEATCTAPDEAGSCERWAGTPHTFLESQDLPDRGTYRASRLQCTPAFFDWSMETNVNVTGAEVVPSSLYAAQFVDILCADTLDEDCFSEVLVLGTSRSGDVTFDFNPPAPTAQPDVLDVAQLVNKFKSLIGAPSKSVCQLQPNALEPQTDVNVLDILAVVDALKQKAYAFAGPCPCPSLMTCGTTACSSDAVCSALPPASGGGQGAKCVKTCVGGGNAGEPCLNDTHGHCPGGVCGNGGMTPGFCRDRCARCKP